MTDVSLTLLKTRNQILSEENARLRQQLAAAGGSAKTIGTMGGVIPTQLAKDQGWHHPEKLEWPGIIVHEFSKGEMQLVQFIVWDKNRGQYILKTWQPKFLKVMK